jgi:hypothetical protein
MQTVGYIKAKKLKEGEEMILLLGCPSFPLLSPPHLFTIATELKYQKKMERIKREKSQRNK